MTPEMSPSQTPERQPSYVFCAELFIDIRHDSIKKLPEETFSVGCDGTEAFVSVSDANKSARKVAIKNRIIFHVADAIDNSNLPTWEGFTIAVI
jgi:hypothetical protein